MGSTVIESGFDTARVAAVSEAEQQLRDARDKEAMAYLERHGALDIAEILGLTPAAAPRVRRKPDGRPGSPPAGPRRRECPNCRQTFTCRGSTQRCCSRSCGTTYAARRRRGEA